MPLVKSLKLSSRERNNLLLYYHVSKLKQKANAPVAQSMKPATFSGFKVWGLFRRARCSFFTIEENGELRFPPASVYAACPLVRPKNTLEEFKPTQASRDTHLPLNLSCV